MFELLNNLSAVNCLVKLICMSKFSLLIKWKPKYLVDTVGSI